MIICIVKATILKDKQDELRRVADILQYEFAANEVGCLQYESFIDGDSFITIERWEDQAALDIHLAAAHVATYVPELKACVEKGEFHVHMIQSQDVQTVIF